MSPLADVRRIIVALDASACSQAALDAAAALAERLHAELHGIFVQDLDLLRLAQLPSTRESGLASAGRRTLDTQSLERAWRMQAARAKSSLDAVARRHRLQSSFRVARGEVVAELLEAATGADMLALGTMGHMEMTGRRIGSTVLSVTSRAVCSVLLLRRLGPLGKVVCVLDGETDAGDRALAWAERLAQARNVDLVLVLPEPADEAAVRRATDRLVDSAVRSRVETVLLSGLDAFLVRTECELLVVPHDSALLRDGHALLGRLSVPVLVAR